MGVKGLRIAAIAFAGAMALAGCKYNRSDMDRGTGGSGRSTPGSSSSTSYGTSGSSGTSSSGTATPAPGSSSDQSGTPAPITPGSSSSGSSTDVNGTGGSGVSGPQKSGDLDQQRSTPEQTQEQQRQHDKTMQDPR
jgi:hypothetical protein